MAKINATAFDADGMAEFLGHLDQVHLIAIHKSRPDVHGKYFGNHVEGAVEWAQAKNANGFNIYWTVNRVRNGFDQKPSKADIVAARYIHVDIDPPRSSEHDFSVAATIETLEGLRHPPTFIVHSGNGLQAFFQLDGDCANLESIERINLQVRQMFNADACHNIDRLMRVVGAVNWPSLKKEALGRKPAMATLVGEHTGELYEPETLAAFFPPAEQPLALERAAVSIGDYELLTADDLGLTPFHILRRALEKPKGEDRSAYGQAAAHEAVRYGLTDAQIAGLLLNPDNPASAHFLAQELPLRAVKRSIGRARGLDEIEEGGIEVAPSIDFSALVANGIAKGAVVPAKPREVVAPTDAGGSADFDWYGPLRGGMKEMVDTIMRYAPSPRMELALGAALACFATAAGRRYQSASGLMTNLYIVGLSASGAGKDLPVNAPGQVLMNTGEEGRRMVGGSEVVSARGIMTAVEASPTLYIPMDEMGKLMQAMQDPRGNLKEAIAVLLKLYSQSQSVFKGAMYANSKDRPTTVIHRPCLGFFGVSNPVAFWDKLTRASISDGLLPRFILLPDNTPDTPPPRVLRRVVWNDRLMGYVKAVMAGAEGYNTFPQGDGAAMAPKPYVVPFEPEDIAVDPDTGEEYSLYEYSMRSRQHAMVQTVEPDMQPFVRRLAENAIKIALVKAVSENPDRPMLRVSDMEWGWQLSLRSVNQFIEQAIGNISENEHEAKAKAVEAAVKSAGADGATLALVGKKCAWISGPERGHILDDLEARGVIEKRVMKAQKGRPTTRYWLADLMPDFDLSPDG